MNKFIAFTFLMLGFGFYQMSGGADFVPETQPMDQIATTTNTVEAVPFDTPQVTRAAAIELTSFTDTAQAEVVPVSLEATSIETETDVRQVLGKRVNMRMGPGTDFTVLDTLTRGTQAMVIEVTADGWARVRVTNTNQVGWMAERLLSDG